MKVFQIELLAKLNNALSTIQEMSILFKLCHILYKVNMSVTFKHISILTKIMSGSNILQKQQKYHLYPKEKPSCMPSLLRINIVIFVTRIQNY